jgi:hypothetical protein
LGLAKALETSESPWPRTRTTPLAAWTHFRARGGANQHWLPKGFINPGGATDGLQHVNPGRPRADQRFKIGPLCQGPPFAQEGPRGPSGWQNTKVAVRARFEKLTFLDRAFSGGSRTIFLKPDQPEPARPSAGAWRYLGCQRPPGKPILDKDSTKGREFLGSARQW